MPHRSIFQRKSRWDATVASTQSGVLWVAPTGYSDLAKNGRGLGHASRSIAISLAVRPLFPELKVSLAQQLQYAKGEYAGIHLGGGETAAYYIGRAVKVHRDRFS